MTTLAGMLATATIIVTNASVTAFAWESVPKTASDCYEDKQEWDFIEEDYKSNGKVLWRLWYSLSFF
jgi:hypothetical protein